MESVDIRRMGEALLEKVYLGVEQCVAANGFLTEATEPFFQLHKDYPEYTESARMILADACHRIQTNADIILEAMRDDPGLEGLEDAYLWVFRDLVRLAAVFVTRSDAGKIPDPKDEYARHYTAVCERLKKLQLARPTADVTWRTLRTSQASRRARPPRASQRRVRFEDEDDDE